MDNIAWGTFGASKERIKEVRYVIPRDEYLTSKENLLTKCKDLVIDIESLYTKVQNKELYDALVTLQSVERSLNSIYIKEEEDDKREDSGVSESES